MIEVEHLTKYYGAFPALRDITFSVEKGEILGFLGPNGAGKTTTMRVITGYIPPTSGTVRVAGYDVVEKSLEARRHIGYLPETVPLYTELTVFEYLDFKARVCGMHNGRERKARIYEVMGLLNIGDVSNRVIGTLSRGYRQRVGLAQAILHNPDVLILDEPTVGLDPVQITEVRALIKELGRNHTIILSTHLLPEVSMVCNRVIIINRGRLVALDTPIHLAEGVAESQSIQIEVDGTPSEVLRVLRSVGGVTSARVVPQQTGTQIAYGLSAESEITMPVAEGSLPAGVHTYRIEGQPGPDLRPRLAAAVVGAGYNLLELKSVRPTLEDVFINVISREEELAAYEQEQEPVSGATAMPHLPPAPARRRRPAPPAPPPVREEPAEGEESTQETAAVVPARTRVSTKRRARR
jgi:ABC-2 type transport system ATP-binding protein